MTSIYHEVATAEMAVSNAHAELKIVKARAETDIIAAANGSLGKNAEERERQLIIGLSEHKPYQIVLKLVRAHEASLATLKADLEVYKDARRQEEWSIRANLIAVLQRRNLDTDPIDSAFDQAADAEGFDQALYDGQNGIRIDPEASRDDFEETYADPGYDDDYPYTEDGRITQQSAQEHYLPF